MHLADTELASWEDVEDPAGGDLPIFRACAHEISDLIDQLMPELEAGVTPDEEIA
jgi:protein-tyrosine-phosphatase